VFARLNRGEDPRSIVEALSEEPDRVWALYEKWRAMGRELVLPVAGRRRLEDTLGVERDSLTVTTLLAAVDELVAAERRLGELGTFVFPCGGGCGKRFLLSEGAWKWLLEQAAFAPWMCDDCERA